MSRLSKLLRELRGTTPLRDIADRAEISHTYLSLLEKGHDPRSGKEIKPSADILQKLSNVYNYPYETLLKAAGYIPEIDNNRIDLLDIFEGNPNNITVAGKPIAPDKRLKILKILDEEKTDNVCVAEKGVAYNPTEVKQQRKKVDLSDMVIAAEAEGYIEMTPISDELREILERIVGDVIDQRERERNNKT